MEPQAVYRQKTEGGPVPRDHDRAIRRRILIISPVWQQAESGGPDVSFLAARLSREGHTVSLFSCCRSGSSDGQSSQYRRRSNPSLMRMLRDLHRRVVEHDLIYLQATPPLELVHSLLPVLMLARFFGKQIVISFAGGNVEDLNGRFSRFLVPMLRLATTITVPTEWSARILAQHRLPVEVVPPAIDTSSATPRLIQDLQPKVLSFLLAGPESNLTTILRAFKLTKQKYPRAELTLVGSDDRLSLAASMMGQVGLVNLVRNSDLEGVRSSWQSCDLLVNNSTDDDLPTPVLTALSIGIPVITCDSGGMTAVVQNRQSGLIFPANDPVALAGRIIELIESPLLVTQLSRSGPVESFRFGWSSVRSSWIPLFNRYSN